MDNDAGERLAPGDLRIGQPCPFCHNVFEEGDVTKVVPPGPRDDVELGKARRGLPYLQGLPLELHVDCGDPRLDGRGQFQHEAEELELQLDWPERPEPERDWVAAQWQLIAAVAWAGYLHRGRGAVVVSEEAWEDVYPIDYVAGAVWRGHEALVKTYDAKRELVIVFIYEDSWSIRRAEALVHPPDAYEMNPVTLLSEEPCC